MNIGQFAIRQKVLASLLMVFIIIVGLVSLGSLRREIFPSMELNYITIQALYPGASAEDIENIITGPIEEAVQSVRGIEEISSASFEGFSSIVIELKSDVRDANRVYNDIKSAVDKVKDLPSDVNKPDVIKLEIEVPIVQVAMSSTNMSETELRKAAKSLEDRVKDIPGVSSIVKSGWRARQFWVEVDPARMSMSDVALSQIINAIRARNVNMPAGKVTEGRRELLVKTTGEIQNTDEVSRIVLRANDSGRNISIGRVADVNDTFAEETVINRVNGRRAICLVVQKKADDDAIRIKQKIEQVVDEFRKTANPSLGIDFVSDITPRIKMRLDTLMEHILLGVLIVMIILFIFMNPTVSVLTSLAIPFSFLTTFLVMKTLGMSINMISLFGLVLVLGMIVDQGIIVAENSYRYLEHGLEPRDAVIKGANEVVMPVISSVLTTIAAFFPMLLIPGLTGKFVHDIPMVVIIALLASLVQAFIVLPVNLASVLKPIGAVTPAGPPPAGWWGRFRHWVKYTLLAERNMSEMPWFKKFLDGYSRTLSFTLKHRKLFTLLTILLFVLSMVFAAGVMKFELFSSRGIDRFSISLKTANNSSLDYTADRTAAVEAVILGLPKNEVKSVETKVGLESAQSRFGASDSDVAVIDVELTDESLRKRSADEIIVDLRKKTEAVPGIEKAQFVKGRQGPATGRAVNIELRADSYSVLAAAAEDVLGVLTSIPGVHSADSTYKEGKDELRITIDDQKASMAGVTVAQAASILRTAYAGMKASSIRQDGEVVDIIVKFRESASRSLDNLRTLTIPNMMGQLVPLANIASFQTVKSLKKVDHIGMKRTVTVSAEVDAKKITSRKANMAVRKKLKGLEERYPGLMVKYTGEEKDTQEATSGLMKAFMLALLLIYLILAVSFQSFVQPIIIMITIPYGIVGIIFALAAHNMPLSFFGLMGIIALAGVIVHDGILMVDFINRERKAMGGDDPVPAVIAGAKKRIRPIILTAATAAMGLLPMAYGIGGRDVMLQPLAVAFMWGLIFGTFLTLLLIPTIYVIFDDMGRKMKAAWDSLFRRITP
jgi:multidrug efflux pump subunit AcrB